MRESRYCERHAEYKSTKNWIMIVVTLPRLLVLLCCRTWAGRRCRGAWGWSGRTGWAPWRRAGAWSPGGTPGPSSSRCTRPHTASQCPPPGAGSGRSTALPWSTSPGNPNQSRVRHDDGLRSHLWGIFLVFFAARTTQWESATMQASLGVIVLTDLGLRQQHQW